MGFVSGEPDFLSSPTAVLVLPLVEPAVAGHGVAGYLDVGVDLVAPHKPRFVARRPTSREQLQVGSVGDALDNRENFFGFMRMALDRCVDPGGLGAEVYRRLAAGGEQYVFG